MGHPGGIIVNWSRIGGEGIENIVWDDNLEVKAKDRQPLLLKEIRDEYRGPQLIASLLNSKAVYHPDQE